MQRHGLVQHLTQWARWELEGPAEMDGAVVAVVVAALAVGVAAVAAAVVAATAREREPPLE